MATPWKKPPPLSQQHPSKNGGPVESLPLFENLRLNPRPPPPTERGGRVHTMSIDDENLGISRYYLICSDHPSNKKHGGICIQYKNFLPFKVTGVRLLEQCITLDLIISNKLCSFVALSRSPSQSQDDFTTFYDNFEMTLDLATKKNPFLLVVLGDFNAK